MTQIPTPRTFQEAYFGEAPWDIGRIQNAFAAVADQVKSPVLDAGCGTGDMALYFAAKGLQVVGIDYLEEPIRRARAKAAERNLNVDFRVGDATKLADLTERFNTVLDSGLFHVFTDDDRRKYVAGLAQALNRGGRVFLMCFSNEEPGQFGPRRITRDELKNSFALGWQIESIEPNRFETNPKFTGATFSEGGPKTWFVTVQRQAT
ncbi:MAG TPA: class I SAM-dependent methyltransferase [Lacipirellulaceae bacterium]|nr:class I SAM-dependent methyltransferase [Lacipirellulaceae bacterium]